MQWGVFEKSTNSAFQLDHVSHLVILDGILPTTDVSTSHQSIFKEGKYFVLFVQKYKFCHNRGLLSKSLTANNDVTQISINRCHCNTNSSKVRCYLNLYFIFAIFLLLPFWNNALRCLITIFSFCLCAVTNYSLERWALFTNKGTKKVSTRSHGSKGRPPLNFFF